MALTEEQFAAKIGAIPIDESGGTSAPLTEEQFAAQIGATPVRQDYLPAAIPRNIPWSKWYERLPADVLAGLGTGGQRMLGAPHRLVDLVSPEIAAKIPEPRNIDVSAQLGVPYPTGTEKFIQSSAQYLPYALMGGVGLLPQMGAGALFGLTQGEHPLSAAVKGALTNLVLHGTGAAGGAGLRAAGRGVKSLIAKSAAIPFAKTLGEGLGKFRNFEDTNDFGKALKRYEEEKNTEGNLWDTTKEYGRLADERYNYDNSSYRQALENKIDSLQKQSERQAAFRRENEPAIATLQSYLDESKHDTFADALEHAKALNIDYRNEITPGKSVPFNMVKFAKGELEKNFNKNLAQGNLDKTLGEVWRSARQKTANINQAFNEYKTPAGGVSPSTFRKFYTRAGGEFEDPTGFVGQYVPKKAEEGIGRMQKLSTILGNDQDAKEAIIRNHFASAFEADEFNPKDFMNKFNKLSNAQQEYLFTPEQLENMRALGKILKRYPEALKKTGAMPRLHRSISGLLGIGGAAALGGVPWWAGVLGGLGAEAVGRAGLRQLAGTPTMRQRIIKDLLFPAEEKAGVPRRTLGTIASQSLVTPWLTGTTNR